MKENTAPSIAHKYCIGETGRKIIISQMNGICVCTLFFKGEHRKKCSHRREHALTVNAGWLPSAWSYFTVLITLKASLDSMKDIMIEQTGSCSSRESFRSVLTKS